eukprot:3031535-Prymnesium_polylepis.1
MADGGGDVVRRGYRTWAGASERARHGAAAGAAPRRCRCRGCTGKATVSWLDLAAPHSSSSPSFSICAR